MAVINPYNYSRPKNVVLKETTQLTKTKMSVKPANRDKQDVYLTQKVMNAKPEELTLMLYEGLVRFIKLAKIAVNKKQPEQAHENAIKAQNIVTELSATLDKSFQFAQDWLSLYDFIDGELVQGNLHKDEKRFDNALEIAEELVGMWRELMQRV